MKDGRHRDLDHSLLTRDIRRSYPEVAGFRQVAGVLDLRHLWHARQSAPRGAAQGTRIMGPGLSALSASVLGKPLDKSMQACAEKSLALSAVSWACTPDQAGAQP